LLFYRAALPLSRKTLDYASRIIRARRKAIGSRRRELAPGQQALLVLACLRKGETFAEMAAGFGVSTTTAWRYVEEVVALLAARAPKLGKAGKGKPGSQKKANARMRGSARPASGQTPSSRPGGSSGSYDAAPVVPGNSPRPSTHCRSRKPRQDEKGSVIVLGPGIGMNAYNARSSCSRGRLGR
jgi:hypothetical protein